MYFTKVLKGIPEAPTFDDTQAIDRLLNSGLICNWWRNVRRISPPGIAAKLTWDNLLWHLQRYGDTRPGSRIPFGQETPYISTTAGVVERDQYLAQNIVMPAFFTALWFATDGLTKTGYIYYGYVITLGKKALPFEEYAEEVRELNTYTEYLRYHPEGEVVAKIDIPSHRLERLEKWDVNSVLRALDAGAQLTPSRTKSNPNYSPPEAYGNIREVL